MVVAEGLGLTNQHDVSFLYLLPIQRNTLRFKAEGHGFLENTSDLWPPLSYHSRLPCTPAPSSPPSLMSTSEECPFFHSWGHKVYLEPEPRCRFHHLGFTFSLHGFCRCSPCMPCLLFTSNMGFRNSGLLSSTLSGAYHLSSYTPISAGSCNLLRFLSWVYSPHTLSQPPTRCYPALLQVLIPPASLLSH